MSLRNLSILPDNAVVPLFDSMKLYSMEEEFLWAWKHFSDEKQEEFHNFWKHNLIQVNKFMGVRGDEEEDPFAYCYDEHGDLTERGYRLRGYTKAHLDAVISSRNAARQLDN